MRAGRKIETSRSRRHPRLLCYAAKFAQAAKILPRMSETSDITMTYERRRNFGASSGRLRGIRNGRLGSWLSLHSFPTKAINAPSTVPYRNPPITNVLRRLCRAAHKSCKLGEMTTHARSYHELTSNPSLQSVRFFLQTRFR